VRQTPRQTQLVNTELVKKSGKAIKLNYLMRENGHGWRIIDVFLKGSISELATKRSEFSSTIKKHGFSGLMKKQTPKLKTFKTDARVSNGGIQIGARLSLPGLHKVDVRNFKAYHAPNRPITKRCLATGLLVRNWR
jgi:hypothetical protein